MPTPVRRLAQIAVRAHDVARATAWYRDVLGLPLLFTAGPDLSFLDLAGVRLMITRPSEPRFDHPSSILYLDVADLATAHAELRSRGAVFERDPALVARLPHAELWMAFLRDTEDNVLALQSEVARPA